MPSWLYTPQGMSEDGKEAISEGMKAYHDSLSEEEREARRDHLACLSYTNALKRRLGIDTSKRRKFEKGHQSMSTPAGNALIGRGQKISASIKALCFEIGVENRAELKLALLQGCLAPPPKSLPYLLMMAAYIDGKPGNGPSEDQSQHEWTAYLTMDELEVMRGFIAAAKERMSGITAQGPIIDVTPSPVQP